MLVSFRWLCELLPQLNREAADVADALSAIGLAVDGVSDYESALASVYLAEVVKAEPHPARDSLQLVTVRTTPSGLPSMPPASLAQPSAQEVLPAPAEITVVCGAKNVPPPGHLVVYAGVGNQLPGLNFRLEPKDIGGVMSLGMLCSEAELGLAEQSPGILTFAPGTAEAGTRFIDAFPAARDVIFELDITPNRPDALGHVGVARDLAAFFEIDLMVPRASYAMEAGPPLLGTVRLENQALERCPRYGAALVRGISLGPSPDWMRWRLHLLGIRPISNVVDITNYLLLEFGQPLHAFDLDRVKDKRIVIRKAHHGETLATLDGVKRTLETDDLVICDGSGPTALAGIMGGADSEIRPETADVLLECAWFEPRGIRRSSRRHGLHTESSHRFERGTDHGMTEMVLERARTLVAELAGGKIAPGILRADGQTPEVPSIELRQSRIDSLLGVDVPFREATRTLARLGLQVEFMRETREGPVALVKGASHRPDIKLEADLIEEIARIRGLDNIPTVLPSIPPQAPRTTGLIERRVIRAAVELGLSEALTYAFVSTKDLETLHAPASVVRLLNPLTEERSVLRTSLLPGLLEALRRARRRGERQVSLFTVGALFFPVDAVVPEAEARPRLRADAGHLPRELPSFACVLAGPRREFLQARPGDVDLYDAKAIASELLIRLTGREPVLEHNPARLPHLHPRGAALIVLEGRVVGSFGPLHPDVVEGLDLDGPCVVVELNLAELEAIGAKSPRYQPIAKLPAVTRDVSLLVKDEIPAAQVADLFSLGAGELCEKVDIVTEFRGGHVPEGQRSLTYRLTYRDPLARTGAEGARTLTDKEVDAAQEHALGLVERELGARLRA